MIMKRFAGFVPSLLLAFATVLPPASAQLPVPEAVRQSELTAPGAAPFYLKASVAESSGQDTRYNATIEEYWFSAQMWRRVVTSPEFSQTVIVNGANVYEKDSRDYYPWWLHDLVDALLNPEPQLAPLMKATGTLGPSSRYKERCTRSSFAVGKQHRIDVFSVYCFNRRGLLDSATTPWFDADYKDFEPFAGREIARKIVGDSESGPVVARITQLSRLRDASPDLFGLPSDTPRQERILRVVLPWDQALALLPLDSQIQWPAVRETPTSGMTSIYISVDRAGQVREARSLNSDNPEVDDAFRAQVKKWRLKPYRLNGVPAQVDTIVALPFVAMSEPYPELSDKQARRLALVTRDPVFDPARVSRHGVVTVQVLVGRDGKVHEIRNPEGLTDEFFPINVALHFWRFRPYLVNGKPQRFRALLKFRAP